MRIKVIKVTFTKSIGHTHISGYAMCIYANIKFICIKLLSDKKSAAVIAFSQLEFLAILHKMISPVVDQVQPAPSGIKSLRSKLMKSSQDDWPTPADAYEWIQAFKKRYVDEENIDIELYKTTKRESCWRAHRKPIHDKKKRRMEKEKLTSDLQDSWATSGSLISEKISSPGAATSSESWVNQYLEFISPEGNRNAQKKSPFSLPSLRTLSTVNVPDDVCIKHALKTKAATKLMNTTY